MFSVDPAPNKSVIIIFGKKDILVELDLYLIIGHFGFGFTKHKDFPMEVFGSKFGYILLKLLI
jgi:hypothetical protein